MNHKAPNTCPPLHSKSPPSPSSPERSWSHNGLTTLLFTTILLNCPAVPLLELPTRTLPELPTLSVARHYIPPCSSNHDFQKVLKGGPIPKISGTFLYKNVWLIMGRLFNPSNNSLFGWIKKVNLIFEQPPLLPVLHRYWCLVNVETMTLFQNWDGWIRTLTSLIL